MQAIYQIHNNSYSGQKMVMNSHKTESMHGQLTPKLKLSLNPIAYVRHMCHLGVP